MRCGQAGLVRRRRTPVCWTTVALDGFVETRDGKPDWTVFDGAEVDGQVAHAVGHAAKHFSDAALLAVVGRLSRGA